MAAALRGWADRAADKIALLFPSEESAQRYSYGVLDLHARRIAAALQSEQLTGKSVLLQAEGYDFVAGLFGCFYAGAIAVPAHQLNSHPKQGERLRAMIDAAELAAVIGTDSSLAAFAAHEKLLRVWPRQLSIASLLQADAADWRELPLTGADLAFIQFTSGSTSDPKGVLVDHGNVICNQQFARLVMDSRSDDVLVSWLPLFHDMGLIAGLLHPLFIGGTSVLLAPMEFIRRPARWLRAISDHRATITGAPNFGYAYAAERIKDADLLGIDLSSMRVAFNGSEPIRAETLHAFADRFAPYGFAAAAFTPCYGMAESTLCVTAKRVGGTPKILPADKSALERGEYQPAAQSVTSQLLTSSGQFAPDCEVVIVDTRHNLQVPDGTVGEIWLRSGSVARGYVNNPEATEATFRAHLADGRGPFLRTGDLGFAHHSELVVTGRSKDLIIVRGRNFYPHDLERTVADCHPAIVGTGVAAVGAPATEYAQEMVVVVAETRRWFMPAVAEEVFAAVAAAFSAAHELAVGEVVLISPGTLPKTSSGKTRRREVLRMYLEGLLPQHTRSAAATTAVAVLADIDQDAVRQLLASVLGADAQRVAADRDLRALGFDSLRAATLCALIEDRWQRQVSLPEVLACANLTELANLIRQATSAEPQQAAQVAVPACSSHLPFPLTPMQQAYWVASRAGLELGAGSLHGYFELEGRIDLPRFERAWNCVLLKHEMLRAVVTEAGEQRILQEVPWYNIAVSDLRNASASERSQLLDQQRERMSHQHHDLQQWPVFEVHASLLPEAARIHCSIDGIFLDFRSVQLVLVELVRGYGDRGFDATPPAGSFRSYAAGLVPAQSRSDYRRSLEFWRARIAKLAPPPQLPLECDPGTLQQVRVCRRAHAITRAHWERVVQHCSQHGVTAASALLAAYGRVLALWSQQQRLTVNVPLFNRPLLQAGSNDVIGNFSSFTLVDLDFGKSDDFADAARRGQHALHEGIAHSRVSGVEVLREINSSEGRLSGRGFPVVFTHLPSGVSEWDGELMGLLARELGAVVYSITQTPQVWLDCQVWYEDGGVHLSWDCVDALFPAGMLDDMFAAYCASLEALGSAEGWSMHGAELLPERDRRLIAVNNSLRGAVPDATVVQLIQAQAARHPERLAIGGAQQLTYAQLMLASSCYANRLRTLGVGSNQRVAIVMRKGWEQLVGVLATLRSGAAYVPIDPELPTERLRFLLNDSGVRAALVEAGTEQLLSGSGVDLPRVCIDESWRQESWRDGPAQLAVIDDPQPQLQDVAYVIYTSGTTGLPKGVMVSHHNVVSMVAATLREFHIDERDSILAVTALSHDLSVFDLLGVWMAGGKVVVPLEDERRDPEAWLRLLHSESVTLWNSVPVLFDMLLEYLSGHALPAPRQLRLAIVGGDWVAPALAAQAAKLLPWLTLCSIGGPTETTVWNIWHRISSQAQLPKKIPYGKPIANNRYYVLNSALQQCPVWVTGELCCAGDGVSLGYLNRPEQTAAKYIWHASLQERLYRTGDLGRLLPDGSIEFMGRADFQVKVQGVRIETGEIEATILKHCPVAAAVVTTVGEGQQRALAAYVVPHAEGKAGADMEAHTGKVITDVGERIGFKLARKGLRQWPDTPLPLPGRLEGELARREFLRRQSIRDFESTPATLQQLGAWLAAAASLTLQQQMLPKYRYPSGGGLYPVQVYLYVQPGAIQGLAGGYYYYDPEHHGLQPTSRCEAAREPAYISTAQPIVAGSAFTVFLVAALDAIEPLYGRLSRDFCLLEAGYLSQLLMQQASHQSLGLCPIGYQDDNQLRVALQLNEQHLLLHTLVGGPITQQQLEQWAAEGSAPRPTLSFAERLLETLQLHLPAALVPKHIVTLERLPITANGKVDRRSLPPPQRGPAQVIANPLPSELSDSERKLAAIWAELLERPTVGVHENFFESGGNSNLLVKFHVRFSEAFGKKVPIAELFRCSTLRELAALLDQAETVQSARSAPDWRGRKQREAARRRAGGAVPHV